MKISKLHPGWYSGRCPGCAEIYMADKRMPCCDDCWPEHHQRFTRKAAEQRLERARAELAAAEAAVAALPAPSHDQEREQ